MLAVILWTGAAWGQEIFCGYGLTGDDSGATRSSGGSASSFAEFTPEEEHFHDGTIKMLVLFATFSDITTAPYDLESDHFEGRSGNTDRSALDLLDVSVSGSFSHYMKEMSRETLTVQGANRTIVTKWYRSKFDSAMMPSTDVRLGITRHLEPKFWKPPLLPTPMSLLTARITMRLPSLFLKNSISVGWEALPTHSAFCRPVPRRKYPRI